MAVVKSKRKEGELTVVTKARELAVYTARICNNEKNFPKRHRWLLNNHIVGSALQIHRNIRKANSVFVKTEPDLDTRRQFQNIALAEIDGLLGDIDIAYELFHIDSSRIKHWVGLIYDVQNLLRNWRKKDIERYKNLG